MSTMRDAFWDAVYQEAQSNKNIIVVSADMGAPALDKFRSNLPDQFINSGIAEQNTITVAAGLALEGKKVFAYAIAPFITLRCFEQIKVTLSMMNIPVTIVGVGAGFSYDDSGPTHHSVEDISTLRTLPHMEINLPSDNQQAIYFAKKSYNLKTPNYIRLDRQPMNSLYSNESNFENGFIKVKEGKSSCIIATGNMVHQALEIAPDDSAVIDLCSIPLNQQALCQELSQYNSLFSIEEHNIIGGIGSYLLEVFNDEGINVPFKRIGADFSNGYCYQYGGREQLQKWCHLDKESIRKAIQQ